MAVLRKNRLQGFARSWSFWLMVAVAAVVVCLWQALLWPSPDALGGPRAAVMLSIGLLLGVAGRLAGTVRTRGHTTERLMKRQRAIVRLGQQALGGTPLDELMNESVAAAADGLGVEYAGVLELLPEADQLLLRAGVGWQPGLVGSAQVGMEMDSQAGYTLASDQPVIVEDLSRERRFRGPALLREHGVVSGLSVIIGGAERPFGVLGAHTRRRRAFIQEDVDFLQAVAHVLAAAVGRKRAEQELEHFFNVCLDMLCLAGLDDGLCKRVNPAFTRILGFTAAEMCARPFMEFVHPEDRDATRGAMAHLDRGQDLLGFENRYRASDGSYRWIQWNCTPDLRRRLTYAAARDVTPQKQVELELRRSSAYHRSLIEASLDPLMTIDSAGRITDVNRATENVTGCSRQELIGTDFSNYFSEPEKARAGYQQVFREGHVEDYELEIRQRDGRLSQVVCNASVYRDEAGQIVGVFAAARDISARKRAEAEIHRLNEELERRVLERTAQLQAAVSELEAFTYSVSHDLRAPLRHIDGFSKILLEECGPQLDTAARQWLQRVRDGTQQMGKMLEDLLNLARTGRREPDKQLTGLASLVEEVRNDLKPEIEEREMEWHIGELPFADCDPALMRLVLKNLLANAIKFTRGRKPAVIEVGQMQTESGPPAIFVRDNGVGFSMKYAHKLFGVFQRLHRREDFEGTGVGLATVQRIIHKHGGRIWAEAELDHGATFYFTLEPVAAGRPERIRSAKAGASS